tara:strand:- start:19406 stop:20299 length:894 start_codon:yes stop_codon:yes gene_type:complete
MQRRNFIRQSTCLAAAVFVPISNFSMPFKQKFKMGLQLFTIRDAMAEDPLNTLKSVKALGYDDLEIYGYKGDVDTYYGYKSFDFNTILKDVGLTATSGHYDFSSYFDKPIDDLKKYVDQCIEGATNIGSKYITWPWLAPDYRTIENFKILAYKLNTIGERVTAAGLGFAYHNHDFEFTDHAGENGYDIILKDTDSSLVKLQMDLYWVVRSSKLTPKELIANQPGRYVMWHIKDMDKITQDYTELGNGSINYPEILPDPSLSGLEFYYLEQGGNFAQNSMQSITDNALYFKENLQNYF